MYLGMPPLPSFSIPRSIETNEKESDQHFRERIMYKVNKKWFMDSKFLTHETRRKAENRKFPSSTQNSLISQ